MSVRLLVAGRRPDGTELGDSDQDEVSARAIQTGAFQVRRCDAPRDLVETCEAIAVHHGKISVLDIYDHGNVGRIRLGSDVLFASDDSPHTELVGRSIATSLSPFLEDTAQVRLLGCLTAGPDTTALAGRLLLIKLARALGGRRITFGTIITLERGDFSRYGLRRELEDLRLFSSLAAIDGAPPTIDDRAKNLETVRALQYGN